LLLLTVMSAPVFAQAGGTVRVTADRTNIRDKPATDGAVVTSVSRGDQLQVLEVSGAWFKVRLATGREGYVHSLFVERAGGAVTPAAAAAPAAAAPSVAAPPPSSPSQSGSAPTSAPRFAGDGSGPLGGRRFGVGLANIGPSIRYWMDAKKGFEVDGYFSSNGGYRVTAISPSFLMRFKEPKDTESVSFLPYFGGGVSFWHFDDGFNDFYCGRTNDCSSSSIGFGGFVGGEAVFKSLPKLGISGNAAFYSSALGGYGGFGIGLGVHYYPGAK
jgi:hypothetical protein